jgi:hypothetical protein
MQTAWSLLCSQQTKLCLCPRPKESGSHLLSGILILPSHLHLYLTRCSFLHLTIQTPYRHLFSPICYTCVTHLILFNVTTQMTRSENKLYSSTTCIFLQPTVPHLSRGKQLPQQLFSNPQSTSFPHYHSPSFTSIWNNRQSYNAVCFNLHIFRSQMGRQTRPPHMEGSCEYTEWTKNSAIVGVGREINNTSP